VTCTRECAVAYLDVLGFKYLIGREKHLARLSEALLDCFNSDLVRQLSEQHRVDYAMFSDSILVRTIETEPRYTELVNMVKFCSWLLSLSIYGRLPLRGAIAWGDVYWDEKSHIRIGTPINEAVGWEAKQAWSGIMLAGSAVSYMTHHRACGEAIKHLLFPLTENLLPLKGDPPRKIKAGIVRPWVEEPREYLRLADILREIGLVSCNLEVQQKLEETACLLEKSCPSDSGEQPLPELPGSELPGSDLHS